MLGRNEAEIHAMIAAAADSASQLATVAREETIVALRRATEERPVRRSQARLSWGLCWISSLTSPPGSFQFLDWLARLERMGLRDQHAA